MKKILIMGLPGAGKTTFAEELVKALKDTGHTVSWHNADSIREKFNDWDFSPQGRVRQAERMRDIANDSPSDYVICDFVAPLKEMRDIFDADYTVWMDTESTSRFSDTDKIFEKPEVGEWNYVVTVKDAINTVPTCVKDILEL